MKKEQANFTRLERAATRSGLPDRVPLAEVGVDIEMMEAFLERPVGDIATYASFWERAGYDYALLQVRGQPIPDASQIKIAEGARAMHSATTVATYSVQGVWNEETFERYPWIGPEDVYYRDVDEIRDHLPEGMKLIVNHGPQFQSLFRIMGIDALSIASVENPALLARIADKVGELSVRIVESLLQREWTGGIWYGDDMGYTGGLIVSPALLRQYVFPYFERMGNLCRQYGKLFILHSDGRLLQVFEDLIQCGFQAIHPNEPSSVDIVELKQRWGDRLAFLGNVDVDLLTRGTPEQVAQATRWLLENVAPGGGFALGSGNSITKHMPPENYRAMLDTVRDCGGIY